MDLLYLGLATGLWLLTLGLAQTCHEWLHLLGRPTRGRLIDLPRSCSLVSGGFLSACLARPTNHGGYQPINAMV